MQQQGFPNAMPGIHFTFYNFGTSPVPLEDLFLATSFAQQFAGNFNRQQPAAQQPQTNAQQVPPQPNAQQQQIPLNFFFNIFSGIPQPQVPAGFNLNDILNQSFQMAQQQKQGPPPTKVDALESLPSYKFTKERKEQMMKCFENCACAVCQCDFERDETMLQLPCQHAYHKDCVTPWLKEHNTCPVCRFELPVEDRTAEAERRKRMTARFGQTGLRIMEIGSEVESVFIRVNNVVEEINTLVASPSLDQQQQNRLKILCAELNKNDALLMQKILALDSLEDLNSQKDKDQRRLQVLKIQTIQSIVDETRKKFNGVLVQRSTC